MEAKMREGECRTTKKGMTYCMKGGRVRFISKGKAVRRRK